MRATLGDRRSRPRLEVVGSLWASLDLSREACVLNISQGGVLIESRVPALVNITHTVTLTLNGKHVRVDARVRHVEPIAGQGPGDSYQSYQIGLEFLEIPSTFTLDRDDVAR